MFFNFFYYSLMTISLIENQKESTPNEINGKQIKKKEEIALKPFFTNQKFSFWYSPSNEIIISEIPKKLSTSTKNNFVAKKSFPLKCKCFSHVRIEDNQIKVIELKTYKYLLMTKMCNGRCLNEIDLSDMEVKLK